jgi:23S rRNA (uracil1939-C5)-methyltransferase
LAAKRSILAEEVRRLGKFDPPEEIAVVSGEPWAYRNRVQLHFENSRMGYHEARSHRLCPIDHCPISSPRLNEAIRSLAAMTRDGRWPRFLRSLELFTDENRVQLNVLESDRPLARRFFEWCGENIPGLVDGALDYEERFRVSPSAFFQVNRFLSGRLVDAALEGAEGDSALDLYAGAGLFSLALARRFKEVVAVESGPAAARDLIFNAERAGLSNLRTETKNAEAYLYALDGASDFIVMDPPRAGLGKTVVARLIELRPAKLVLVACDPSTMARDVGTLLRAGYAIDRMTLVDMFPQTYHFETVVSMSRTD